MCRHQLELQEVHSSWRDRLTAVEGELGSLAAASAEKDAAHQRLMQSVRDQCTAQASAAENSGKQAKLGAAQKVAALEEQLAALSHSHAEEMERVHEQLQTSQGSNTALAKTTAEAIQAAFEMAQDIAANIAAVDQHLRQVS